MGAFCSRAKPFRILFQGLDAAGKTTVLYQLKLGEVVTTIPTIGFNVEEVSVGNVKIVAWDVGGRDKIRPLYRHYYPNTDGFVYIIDSNDHERLDDALDEFVRFILCEDETKGRPVMILGNKQDLEGALPLEKIENEVKAKISSQGITLDDRIVFVTGCSAVKGEGLNEAFSLFSQIIRQRETGKITPGFRTVQSLEEECGQTTKTNGSDDNQSYFHFLKKVFGISYVKSLLFY